MKGKHLKLLRERTHLSQAEMAKILKISLRTLAKWESEENNIIHEVYIKAYRISFENLLLSPILRRCTEKVFEKIPSEFIGIWLVRHSLFPIQYAPVEYGEPISQTSFWELVLHENTSRYQKLGELENEKNKDDGKESCKGNCFFNNDKIHKNMNQISQTTYPLHSGETINLTGEDIVKFPYKRFPGRANFSYHDQVCHSMLHVPYHIPSVAGPQPVALLSLENRLKKDESNKWVVKTFFEKTKESAFSKEDEQIAKNLIQKIYEEDLKEILEVFEYILSS